MRRQIKKTLLENSKSNVTKSECVNGSWGDITALEITCPKELKQIHTHTHTHKQAHRQSSVEHSAWHKYVYTNVAE